MDDLWRAGAPGETAASTTTRVWRIVADIRELDVPLVTIPTVLPVTLTRLLKELRSESVPDDGSKYYNGPPIGYSWQTVIHEDGQKEEVGTAGGVRGRFREVACREVAQNKDCDPCFQIRLAAATRWLYAHRAAILHPPTSTYGPPELPRPASPPIRQRTYAPAPTSRVSPPVEDRERPESPVTAAAATHPPATNLSAAAPDFDEKAYWKAREARAKAAIHALNVPTGPSAKPSGSRVNDAGIVFSAKSIDYRPAALRRRNDQRTSVRTAAAKRKSSALPSSYTHTPTGVGSSASTSTARSPERRGPVASVDDAPNSRGDRGE